MRNLSLIQNEISAINSCLQKNPNIIALYIFGSYGTAYYNKFSDIDFAVLYDKIPTLDEELALEIYISDILKRDDVDVVNLNKAPINLKHNVIYTGDLLYCKDDIKLADFKEYVFNVYGDYGITLKYFYDDYIKGLSKNAL
ncbi:type VII toxin-antitoxin system MntA family adenylyltransferase antitoxin [Caldanaerobius polysaccharolyticus]|uniref:type VII toxin-antitoxin system MntA family adenylyltransferase antitoxin n=1 Tax=Caldanaerobius polysaccharolyticus TaxID=44256 RepID=UPI00047C1F58|nr:nucleotidyltransferase domain-containing protein [Caldanaerobius polysaccharolyticus]